MQKKNYDSEFCGSVPLNYVNQIQSYGILVVLDRTSFNIVQVSQNISALLQIDLDQLIDTNYSGYILPEEFAALKNTAAKNVSQLPLHFTFTNGVRYLGIVHAKENMLLIELEPTTSANGSSEHSFTTVYQEVRYAMAAIDEANTLEEACDKTVRELKRLSGFDRVMVYKFDEDWNGSAIAETKEDDMEPYLGLRFPASDIPKQARALYLKNAYRQIPDRNYKPVKLYPVINPLTNSFTDLSDCNLRGVPAVHIEYLGNMNATCSMSTRIIKDGKLWGLISCHHKTAKFLNYEQCTIFELLSNIISTKISSLQSQNDLLIRNTLRDIQTTLLQHLYKDQNEKLYDGLQDPPKSILSLLNVEGVAIVHNNNIDTIGITPALNELKNLILWLQSNVINKTYNTTSISTEYEAAEKYSHIASGMIVLPIHAEKGEYIIGFRPEAEQLIQWGGNPDEAIRFEENSKNYHPRNSFSMWKQTVKKTSLPWHEQELDIAEQFRNTIVEYALKNIDR